MSQEVDMSTMTHSVLHFPESRHSYATTAATVVLFWAVAATAVVGVHLALDSVSQWAAVAVKAGTIVLGGWLYVRLTARRCTIDHALLVGLVWLLLDIGAEIVTSRHLGRGWFNLIGTPRQPALRDLLLLTWVVAPALFATCPANGEKYS
jgi:uncharacterized membrane protein YgdD (TMEM256/DUF423 family)